MAQLERSVSRCLDPAEAVAAATPGQIDVIESRPLGGAWVLDHLWHLGIDQARKRLRAGRKLDPRGERVVFALVANRALEPLSKLAGAQWVRERVFIPGLPEVDQDSCYRAMGFLLKWEKELAKAVHFSTAELLDLSVDLISFSVPVYPGAPPSPGPLSPLRLLLTFLGLPSAGNASSRLKETARAPLGRPTRRTPTRSMRMARW